MTRIEKEYHIPIKVNKKEFRRETEDLRKEFLILAQQLKKLGADNQEAKRTAERFRGRIRRLDRTLERELQELGEDIIDRIVDRYFSFVKAPTTRGKKQDGSTESDTGPRVGRTGRLAEALRNYEQNIEIEVGEDEATMGIMSRDYLSDKTPARPTSEHPYYIYQQQAIKPGGPRYFRHFITQVTGAVEQVREEDEDLIRERIEEIIEEVLNEERNI